MNTANKRWLQTVISVLQNGRECQSRAGSSLELINHTSAIDMRTPIVTVIERKLLYKFLAGEAWWLISGSNRVEDIAPYNKHISQFSDNGTTFFGAYGPKWIEQREYVVNALRDDNSRQAVFTIWRESPPKSKDIPCTVSIQFLLRNGVLHCIDNMRSSDVFLGYPYDIFNFAMLTACIALDLRVAEPDRFRDLQMGTLFFNAGSRHVYDSNIERLEECIAKPDAFAYEALDLDEFKDSSSLLSHLKLVADLCAKKACPDGILSHRFLREIVEHTAV
tara:strand:- start:25 stop:855 length:831 start_codon:yes stop_codon:yes gene_type:complete